MQTDNKKIKKLVVTTPQGVSGMLHHESRYSFNYTSGERESEISLLMPIRPESYSSGALPIVFAMNKPEGFLLQKLMSVFAKQGGLDDMKLLALVGDNQIGRLQYSNPDTERTKPHRPQVGLQELLKQHPTQSMFDFLVDSYLESGISGMQPKVMIPDADKPLLMDSKTTVIHSNLIVKAGGDDYPFLTQNEFLCMEAARRSDILVPDFWLSDDGGLFIMERFDLNNSKPLGFEDMSVLMGKQPDPQGQYKYQGSYENIAMAIQLFCRDVAIENKQKFFEYVALSIMVRNGDAHLKNFGLLYDHPTAEQAPVLAPLYDVVTTTVYPHINMRTGLSQTDRTMALKLNKDKSYPLLKDLLLFGADTCHVSKPHIIIDKIATAMTETLLEHREKIDPNFFDLISTEWDIGRMSLESNRVFISQELKTSTVNIVQEGTHRGVVLDVIDNVVIQKIGRDPDTVVRHDLSRLSNEVKKGDVADIKYKDGVGEVSIKAKGVER